MTNAELLAKIKAEIERRIKKYRDGGFGCHANSLEELLSFLSTLESEKPVPAVLEEAVDNHIRRAVDAAGHPGWDWTTQDIAEAFIAGAKWHADHTPLPEDTVLFNNGVEEGKRLMMEEAVEGDYDCQYMTPAVFLDKYLDGIKDGDKVRVIVLPKED